jgi:hypothetical protein
MAFSISLASGFSTRHTLKFRSHRPPARGHWLRPPLTLEELESRVLLATFTEIAKPTLQYAGFVEDGNGTRNYLGTINLGAAFDPNFEPFTSSATGPLKIRIDPEPGEQNGDPVTVNLVASTNNGIQFEDGLPPVSPDSMSIDATTSLHTDPNSDLDTVLSDDHFYAEKDTYVPYPFYQLGNYTIQNYDVHTQIGATVIIDVAYVSHSEGTGASKNLYIFGGTYAQFGLTYKPPSEPDLVATSLTRNDDGSVGFSYDVRNAPLPRDTTVALYWAHGSTFADHIGNAVYSIPAQKAVGSYGPFTVDANTLGTRPPGATNLIVMADPDDLIPEDPNRDNNVAALAPDIVVDSVKTQDSKDLFVDYDINTSIPQPFNIGIFRSPTQNYDPSQNTPLTSVTISGDDEALGHHTIEVKLDPGQLWPGFSSYKYVLAVADPGSSLQGFGADSAKGYYRNYVIGAVSVGYNPTAWGQDPPPDWVGVMADSLGVAGYDAVIPFSWASGLPSSQAILDAGDALTGQVLQAIDSFGGLQPNDVVDLHLIGHSRGSVVISLAMQELLNSPVPQLQHGYLKMTLLDPHPANLAYGTNADFNPLAPPVILAGYLAFEAIAQDPPVVIPGRVNEVEQFWQQNTWDVPPLGSESILNLWGLDPGSIQYGDPTFTLEFNYPLTGVAGIGHSEVHDYYQANFIPGGPASTARSRGGAPRNGEVPIVQAALFGPAQPVVAGSLLREESPAGSTSSHTKPGPVLPFFADRAHVDQYFTLLPRAARALVSSRSDPAAISDSGFDIRALDDVWLTVCGRP